MFPLIQQELLTKVWSSTQIAAGIPEFPQLGSLRCDKDGNVYKFVKNTEATALVVGDVVVASFANAVGYEVMEYLSGTNFIDQMAGVAMGAIGASGYGWIQVYGYNATINMLGHASNAIGASQKLVTSERYCTFDSAGGTEASYAKHIVSLEAYTTTSAATKKGFIFCLG